MKHSMVRNTIVETAARLFYQNGYNLTGINEIIKEAGVAKATLYNHFKSKEAICIAYLEHKNNTFIKDLSAFINKRPQGEEQLLGLFDFLGMFYNQESFNGCWCINMVSEIPRDNVAISAIIKRQKDELIDYISNLLKTSTSNLSEKELDSKARQIYLLYESAVSESHLHNEIWPIESAKSICKSILT